MLNAPDAEVGARVDDPGGHGFPRLAALPADFAALQAELASTHGVAVSSHATG